MRYHLIDRILEIEPGRRIVAVKNLSAAEEYLADHFPGFPIMPGVLMLEAMTQAGAWLIRLSEDFAHSIILLKSARGVRYANFVEPGKQLILEADVVREEGRETSFKAKGTIEGSTVVSGRLTLVRFNLAERNAELARLDAKVIQALRQLRATLMRGARVVGEASPEEASPLPGAGVSGSVEERRE